MRCSVPGVGHCNFFPTLVHTLVMTVDPGLHQSFSMMTFRLASLLLVAGSVQVLVPEAELVIIRCRPWTGLHCVSCSRGGSSPLSTLSPSAMLPVGASSPHLCHCAAPGRLFLYQGGNFTMHTQVHPAGDRSSQHPPDPYRIHQQVAVRNDVRRPRG